MSSNFALSSVAQPDRVEPATTTARPARITSIDALRGLVILLMLVDHAREFFFLHAQVSDPMDVAATDPVLFFTRLSAHLCAPVFVALTGLAAFLYAAPRGGAPAASAFLAKRGLFLILLELTVVGLAWNFDLTPERRFLQVIWAIGVSMLALAALVHLPRAAIAATGLVIIFSHNLLDPISFAPGTAAHAIWAVLHERALIDLPWGGDLRTSYPVLPWIGIIALGYAIGPWFQRDAGWRRRALVTSGFTALALFIVQRAINLYGETPWQVGETGLQTLMSILNVTKYPPSLAFVLLTLGIGTLVLAAFEHLPATAARILTEFGAAPLFFYILHLYVLNALNHLAGAMIGADGLASVPNVASLWLLAALVALPCWFACRWFGRVKRASGAWWMRYL